MRFGAAVPRSERSAPEQNTGPEAVRTMARTAGAFVAVTQRVVQFVEQARRERVAVVR